MSPQVRIVYGFGEDPQVFLDEVDVTRDVRSLELLPGGVCTLHMFVRSGDGTVRIKSWQEKRDGDVLRLFDFRVEIEKRTVERVAYVIEPWYTRGMEAR